MDYNIFPITGDNGTTPIPNLLALNGLRDKRFTQFSQSSGSKLIFNLSRRLGGKCMDYTVHCTIWFLGMTMLKTGLAQTSFFIVVLGLGSILINGVGTHLLFVLSFKDDSSMQGWH